MTESEQLAIEAVRNAALLMNVALRKAHEAGLGVEIDVLNAQTVSDEHPLLIVTGHCQKIAYEINQPF